MTLTQSWETPEIRQLFSAVLNLEDSQEMAAFFRDLCTVKEISDMAGRWAVVRRLDEGLSYREISELTGAATATITRINQWLRHGTGGYRLALSRIGERSRSEERQ